MKKTLSAILVCVFLVGVLFTLTSCAQLSGSYEFNAGALVTTYKFSGSSVTITLSPIYGEDTVLSGKYEIVEKEDGTNSITFTFDNEQEEAEDYEGTFSFSKAEDGSYIKIAGLKFTKK